MPRSERGEKLNLLWQYSHCVPPRRIELDVWLPMPDETCGNPADRTGDSQAGFPGVRRRRRSGRIARSATEKKLDALFERITALTAELTVSGGQAAGRDCIPVRSRGRVDRFPAH